VVEESSRKTSERGIGDVFKGIAVEMAAMREN